jgi:uncharacterized protein YjiS (DUF1127 family)
MSPFEQAQSVFECQQQNPGDIRAWLSRLGMRFARLAAAWLDRRRTARSLRQLHICTDRELWDMGLSRSDFPAIIKGTYRRD